VLLAVALLALALVLSPLGLGLASADDDGGEETDSGPSYYAPPGFTGTDSDGDGYSGNPSGPPESPDAPPPPDGGLGGPNSPPDFETGQGLCCGSDLPGADPFDGGGWL